jgi:hypothetical protein
MHAGSANCKLDDLLDLRITSCLKQRQSVILAARRALHQLNACNRRATSSAFVRLLKDEIRK